MDQTLDISVVVPLYNEEESLPELTSWIHRVMVENRFSYETILVDDGSNDRSWAVIQELARENSRIRALRLNHNYGKSAALDTGFHHAQGQVVITMDADLQDSPDEIPELYRLIRKEGYDLISGWKKKRYDPISKTVPSKFFNRVTSWMSGIRLHDFNCGLKAYRHQVVKSIDLYGEMHRYIPVIAKWNGFGRIGEKVVEHRARKYGSTKFGWQRFVYGFLDLLSVMFVTRFKKRPMHFFGSLGTLFFMIGFAIAFWLSFEKFLGVHKREVVDQPIFFLSLVAIIAGMQLFLAGFLGEMITQSNNRKTDYIVAERI
ncbi:Glycosyltransferase involved in cell wall bisynthesis [Catalinimonas alkaloidigena]|uniref:Glycosyltransferase involved in cell wall bisynthesis n=1 Tax=Catalinimonas alkaloidigena TaxID=1075417 RepID=A0A1G9US82_9BACT|nr:glycosyltransferase family 2 protein [Catalinimonas alkaloidigena]SDM62733.1 Glycosyltransferase involved in cell wall bisynthesis [Catalinimonas alkaloidigena]